MGSEVVCDSQALASEVAVVTGASGGVGAAIAVALAKRGATIFAVGRNREALDRTLTAVRRYSDGTACAIDLTAEDQMRELRLWLEAAGRVDILIHSAGAFQQQILADAPVRDLDSLYAVNVRAPYFLTQQLVPFLIAARGQVVFINSSAGLSARRPDTGQYAATKHALKAIADSLREEVNPKGIRVLTLYLGRTATPMQEALFQLEGREYHPELLLQPEDVATLLVHALMLPRTAEVTDISVRPMIKTVW